MEKSISLLVVDDHPILREGIISLIKVTPDIVVIGTAIDGTEAVDKVRTLDPDVILIDLVAPREDGIETIHQIKELGLHGHILVITSLTGEDTLFLVIQAGASGYLMKNTQPDALMEAIREVYRSNGSLQSSIARKLIERYARQPQSKPPTPADLMRSLTTREYEVLRLAAAGLTNKEIAVRLTISNATVRSHISNITTKLKLVNRTQAILFALREGLVSQKDF